MASPQVEKGFTRIANELLEALYRADLNGTEFRIMLMLIRETYGKQQLTIKLSYTRIAGMLNQPRPVIGKNLHDLLARRFIVQRGDGDLSEWQVQKDYDRWLGSHQSVTSKQSVPSDQTVTSDKLTGSHRLVTGGSHQSVTQLKKDVKKERNGVAHAQGDTPPPLDDEALSLNQLGITDTQAAKVIRIFGRSVTPDEIERCRDYLADGKRGIGLLLSEWLYKRKVPPKQYRNGTNGHSRPNSLAPPPPDTTPEEAKRLRDEYNAEMDAAEGIAK